MIGLYFLYCFIKFTISYYIISCLIEAEQEIEKDERFLELIFFFFFEVCDIFTGETGVIIHFRQIGSGSVMTKSGSSLI